MLTNDEAKTLFQQSGALLTGHFKLSSGLHSDQYLEKFRLAERPEFFEQMAAELASRFSNEAVDFVLGPTTAGIILAYAVARHLAVGARFAERENGIMSLRRGQVLPAGARVLVVDDILTTGGAVKECLAVVERHNATLVGVGVLGDRSGGTLDIGTRLEAVLTMKVEAVAPDICPQCAQGIPLYQPGTKRPG